MSTPTTPPAGWYEDPAGSARQRWFDGKEWTEHYQGAAAAPTHVSGPLTASKLNVKREVSYNRQQKGHSITKYILLSLVIVGLPGLVYYSVSPNHYWHA
jgi:hypothetical protein